MCYTRSSSRQRRLNSFVLVQQHPWIQASLGRRGVAHVSPDPALKDWAKIMSPLRGAGAFGVCRMSKLETAPNGAAREACFAAHSMMARASGSGIRESVRLWEDSIPQLRTAEPFGRLPSLTKYPGFSL